MLRIAFIRLIFSLILGGGILLAQGQQAPAYPMHSLDSVPPSFFENRIFMLGEIHPFHSESQKMILTLIEGLAAQGVKDIGIFMEYPASAGYWVYRYAERRDSLGEEEIPEEGREAMITTTSEGYYIDFPWVDFVDSLRRFEDTLHFTFIPMDVEYYSSYPFVREMVWDMLAEVTYYPFLQDLLLAENRRKMKRVARRIIREPDLQNLYAGLVPQRYWHAFFNSIESVSKHGFMLGGVSDKKMDIRDKHMAQVIERTYEEVSACIMLFGRDHIKPRPGEDIPQIIQHMDVLEREDIMLLPILYPQESKKWRALYYDGIAYPNEAPLTELLEDGIFDMIIFAPKTEDD